MSHSSLLRDISPPPVRRTLSVIQVDDRDRDARKDKPAEDDYHRPSLASIEAGKATIGNHLDYFCERFQAVSRSDEVDSPLLSITAFRELYLGHQHEAGCHFVVHQHDHPIAGVHYDLRLQFSATSTISFAIPYGLPGNANSSRPNRMAIETRVHNLWNNLIESASLATGSLLIWDTGRYEILPYRQAQAQPATDDELSEYEHDSPARTSTDSERLFAAFQDRHIRLRLHGCRLPSNYTITLRLTKSDRYKPSVVLHTPRKRRRIGPKPHIVSQKPQSESDDEIAFIPGRSSSPTIEDPSIMDAGGASDGDDPDDDEREDATIRANNAYTGSTNTIGSIHQRHWFLSLDKPNSGFTKTLQNTGDGRRWTGGWEPFFVMGRDVERSVVTRRTADQVMHDEGVKSFTGRKMWRPITE